MQKERTVMESMDADWYVLERMVRDRLIEARAKARVAALLAEANYSRRSWSVRTRLMGLGRELVNTVRKAAAEISHSLPGRPRMAKHS
jgi:hypothetical protein